MQVCNWLMMNNLSVLIAACDTFRAGAVEQLKVHSRALGVGVFESGYNKDAAQVAEEAIRWCAEYSVCCVPCARDRGAEASHTRAL